ncbi:MAG: tetratricopeptide repeat protein [Polyangiaceae bacterium]
MTKLGTKWLFASTLAATLAAVSFGRVGDVAAQPAGAGAAPATAGDAGAPSTASADAGAPSAASADGGASTPPTVPTYVPTVRKMSPPPPPPSPEQIRALEALKAQVDVYEQSAREYRDTVTTIIRLHYEAKKREVLSGLDQEIAIEKAELKKARAIAIKRLEEFIEKYSGPRADPVATPDAMYRLAALYEERARSEEATEPMEIGLKPAIGLYKRAIKEFPDYRELAGLYYFLGHALADSGRMPEGQQVWRSLVCHNHYPYPTAPDPKDPEKDTITPMPQDHDEGYWTSWRQKYRLPASVKKGGPETTYQDPFPQDCTAIPQKALRPGEEPKYVAEVWWQIGNWEFDLLDVASGVTKDEPGSVFGYNRAASAYQQSMKFKKPPLYGVALYKYAWALFKQQRYEAATREFVHLLQYTDEQEAATGDKGADFRGEAYTYIAGSITNLDFVGPGEKEPYIMRPDIIDTEPRPDVAEKKLHVAIDRVQDPQLIPQDKPWTIEVYRALALEYRSLNMFNNAVEVYELMLKKWPMDPTAPDVQNAIAETYDQLNMTQRPGTPEHDAIAQKALEARTKLANYIGNTPWVDANKDNPAALQNAERLVRGGLRQAAAQHTNNGKAALVAASETDDPRRQLDLLVRASTEYKLAALGWQGYIRQDENAPDAYESRYWLADARRQVVRIQVVLHKLNNKEFGEPTKKDIGDALAAAIEVRDSNEDDKYLDNVAFFVVDVSDVDRDLAYQRYDDSKGTQGVQRREEVKFDNEDPSTRKVIKDPIPPEVMQSMQARDDYVARVPPSLDLQKHGPEYQYYVAETYFLYGDFAQARARLEPMWKEHCAKDEYGYKAWERLITMSNLERDATRSTQLAEAEKAKSCAVSAEQTAKAGLIVNPTLQEAAFVNARKKFEQAKNAPPGPERDKLWREAAGMYEAALEAAPARDEAPEAAMNAAYAYKQVGEYNKAIALYNKFITEYGSDERLTKLQKGDPKTKTAPNLKKYEERVKYLGDAYDALGTTYYSFFNYQRAAETYDKVATNPRFTEQKRRDAAKNAMLLYASMGQRDKMMSSYKTFVQMKPPAEERANADYLVASYDYRQWNPTSGDSGANRQTRFAAERSLTAYFQANRNTAGAAKYLVEAAYAIGKMKRSANDVTYKVWFRSTVATWENFKAKAPVKDGKSEAQSPPYVDYAAEADLALVDDEIKSKFDSPDKHKYSGAVSDVVGEVNQQGVVTKKGKYQLNAADAEKWDQQLDRITKTYQSLEWVPAAYARRGAIFDTLRTGLYNTVPPALKYFTAKEEAFLKSMENSGRQELQDKADELRDAKKEFWRKKKDQELSGADQLMVRHYATAVAMARKYNVKNAYVSKAISRLAYFTDIIGDAKMKGYVEGTADPINKGSKLSYRDGQYMQTRPGLSAIPTADGSAAPLPAAP